MSWVYLRLALKDLCISILPGLHLFGLRFEVGPYHVPMTRHINYHWSYTFHSFISPPLRRLFISRAQIPSRQEKNKSVCFLRDLSPHSGKLIKKEKRGETSRMAQPLFFFILSHLDKTVTERIRPRPSSCHRTPRSPARANRTRWSGRPQPAA